jgi:hypothetical protein
MSQKKFILERIEEWVMEGLISPQQADLLRQKEREIKHIPQARRVNVNEIVVYLGSLIIFLALALLVGLNWDALGSTARILSVVVPTVCLLALGWWLRGSTSGRLQRGAQAVWLGGCLTSGLAFGVTLYELGIVDCSKLQEMGPAHPLFITSFLLATCVSGFAFLLLTTATQSIVFHLCGSAALLTLVGWLDYKLVYISSFHQNLLFLGLGLATAGLWLALSEWLLTRERKDLILVSRGFGALTVLGFTVVLAMQGYALLWQEAVMAAIAFLADVFLIAASVKRQSQIFLYSGAAGLLVLITYLCVEYFADRIGMPIALLIIGALFIGLGLGTRQLVNRIRTSR